MSFKIDFSKVEDGNIPEGVYPAVVASAEVAQARDGENYNVVWRYEITDGAYAGRSLRMWSSLKPTALWSLKATLKALGIDASGELNIEVSDDGTVLSPELVGLPCAVSVIETVDDNKIKRSNIGMVLPITDLDDAAPGGVDGTASPDRPAKKGGLKLK